MKKIKNLEAARLEKYLADGNGIGCEELLSRDENGELITDEMWIVDVNYSQGEIYLTYDEEAVDAYDPEDLLGNYVDATATWVGMLCLKPGDKITVFQLNEHHHCDHMYYFHNWEYLQTPDELKHLYGRESS